MAEKSNWKKYGRAGWCGFKEAKKRKRKPDLAKLLYREFKRLMEEKDQDFLDNWNNEIRLKYGDEYET